MTKRRMLLGLIGREHPGLVVAAAVRRRVRGGWNRRLLSSDGRRPAAGADGCRSCSMPSRARVLPAPISPTHSSRTLFRCSMSIDPEAAQVGAINTVAIATDGRTTGYNFDRRGWRNSFAETFGADQREGQNRSADRRRRRRPRRRFRPDGSGRWRFWCCTISIVRAPMALAGRHRASHYGAARAAWPAT